MAAERVEVGDFSGALEVLEPLQANVIEWLAGTLDADIADDLIYINKFITNIGAAAPLAEAEDDPEDPDWEWD